MHGSIPCQLDFWTHWRAMGYGGPLPAAPLPRDRARAAPGADVQLLWLWLIQAQPAYLGHLLPAQLLGGAGVGLTIPSLLGAGSMALTPARFGTGSGILNTARQVGTVLGVAGLVAILSRVSQADPVTAYRNGLLLVIGFFAAAGVVSALLLAGRPAPVPASSAPSARSSEAGAPLDSAVPEKLPAESGR